MSRTYDPINPSTEHRNLDIRRGFIALVALVAIVTGVAGLVWTGVTLLAISFLFGVFLIVAGVYRIANAIDDLRVSTAGFVINLIVGAVLLVTGFVCLNDSAQSIAILAIVVGIGWIFDGVGDLFAAGIGYTRGRRGLVVLSGLVSIAAGILVLFLPELSLAAFVRFGAILLIFVGVTALLTLPRRASPSFR